MKVLIGVDGSDDALRAVAAAAHIFGDADGVEFLLVIVEEDRQWERTLTSADVMAFGEQARSHLQGNGHDATVLLESGQPAARIVAVADAEQVDIIVLGRRGLHGLSRLLAGSVSSAVLERAPVPVLVVP